jgi:hypothetical protein
MYHEGMELIFPDLTIRTRGWVSLRDDQSISLLAELPIPPKWLAGDARLRTALRNQTIRLPIGGTLSKPRLDRRAVEQASRQFIQRAAGNVQRAVGNVIEDETNKLFDRLLPPRQ